jgi:sec-independent protein translocase protein TatC
MEKRWMFPIVVGATLAFIGGMAFAYYVVLPVTLEFLFSFGSGVAEPDIRISYYINFVTRMLLVLGLVFETPLLVMGLAKAGVVNARKLLKMWRFAIVGAFVLSAIVTPTIDPVTQSLVAGPIVLLYFVGIGLAWLVRRN